MECPPLSTRVSTRASLFSSAAHRHLSSLNASHLPSSSRPAPATPSSGISPALPRPINGSRLISAPRRLNLVPGSHFSPTSTLCPALSSTQIAPGGGDGQFSDADSDQEGDKDAHKRKKVKPNSSHPKGPSLSQPTKGHAPRPSSQKSTLPHRADTHQARPRTEAVVGRGLAMPSRAKTPRSTNRGLPLPSTSAAIDQELPSPSTSAAIDQGLPLPSTSAAKPSIHRGLSNASAARPSIGTGPSRTPLTYDSKNQLPLATRRLAMLVGMPESSQAIIQSTLSIPPNHPSRSNTSQPHASTSRPRAQSNNGMAGLPASDSMTCSRASSYVSSDSAPRRPKSISSAGASPVVDARQVQAPRSAPATRAVPALAAHPSESGSQARNPIAGPSRDTRTAPATAPGLIAPRYGRASNSSAPDDYTMPTPGSFSIRAPPCAQLLHAYDPSLVSSDASGSAGRADNRMDGFDGSSEMNPSSQPPSTCPPHSPTASSSHAGMRSEISSSAPVNRNKRKPRAKPAPSQVELVRPPPTINGKVSHSRKVPAGYIKRTPNSFLMFRSHVIANKLLPPGVENDNRQISRIVSGLWAGLSEQDLHSWQTAASELRAAARARYPDMKHAPNQKRKDVVRRRRVGQLPGETPKQQAEREKATAAALAQVIISSRGERLDRDRSVESGGVSARPSSSNASTQPSNPPREVSRPQFRAPAFSRSHAPTPRSEYAESTLTNSPVAEVRRSLPRVPEGNGTAPSAARQESMTPRTSVSRLSTENPTTGCPNSAKSTSMELPFTADPAIHEPQQGSSTPANAMPRFDRQASQSSQSTVRPPAFPSAPASSQAAENSSGVPYGQPGTQSQSGGFSHVAPEFEVPESFRDTFSDVMLRALGITAVGLNLDLPASSSLPTPPTTSAVAQLPGFPETSFGMRDRLDSSGLWSQDSALSALGQTTAAEYPFRESTASQGNSSHVAAQGTGPLSFPTLSQPAEPETSNPLDFSSLVDTAYADQLQCDDLNFEAMFLSYQSSNQAMEEARQALATDLTGSGSGTTNGGSATLNPDCTTGFWPDS
ncbi:hypothetical protein PCANC_14298 [Puccinia coronata f. sp. avenae]|uniref:HMG box domain-containing protein n=1 Tax=Puccinia coronata f. sp. avenae TaxID=200324 RepID=A0A2N5VLG9_9BASI|nr:hypothetical protein PCANC_14298 [Puccinia coronata f. sp. avenae]